MPETQVILFKESDGSVPLNEWLAEIPKRAKDKCVDRIEELQRLGHEMRRPKADYLRDDVYELRAAYRRIQYRVLYFFHGRMAVVLSHGIVKEGQVPPKEIDFAIRRKQVYMQNPDQHTLAFEGEL